MTLFLSPSIKAYHQYKHYPVDFFPLSPSVKGSKHFLVFLAK